MCTGVCVCVCLTLVQCLIIFLLYDLSEDKGDADIPAGVAFLCVHILQSLYRTFNITTEGEKEGGREDKN